MLKKIRISLAAFFIFAVTLLFLDYTGTVHDYLGWCAKVQFSSALFACNIVIFAGLILITLLFGRIYCSVICPLGIFQDAVSRFASIKKKNRFSYRPSRKSLVALRFALLVIFILSAIIHISVITVILDPYSAYGRMVSQIGGPVYKFGNNLLAYFAESAGSYAFYTVDVWIKGISAFVIAVLTLTVVSIFAWKSGRGYCNTICPVGAFLGIIAKFSLIKIRINDEKCKKCGICAKNCKAACIDHNAKKIDYFRCVACFNCMDSCSKEAINYTIKRN